MAHIDAVFVKGIIGTDPILEDGKPQIAFFGRSNVGKSSCINTLVGQSNLVKTSATPGQTQQINLFLINRTMYFIDLPGYGYAKVPKEVREKITKHLYWYITEAPRPACSILIIDGKVGATRHDEETIALLQRSGHNVVVVANKADKVPAHARENQAEKIRTVLGTHHFLWYSSRTNEGRNELMRDLLAYGRMKI